MTQQVKEFNVFLSWRQGFNISALLNEFFEQNCITFVDLDVRYKKPTVFQASDAFITLSYQPNGGRCSAYAFTGDQQESATSKANTFFAANPTIWLLKAVYITPPGSRYTDDDNLVCITTENISEQNIMQAIPVVVKDNVAGMTTAQMQNPFSGDTAFLGRNISAVGADPTESTWVDGGLSFAIQNFSPSLPAAVANWSYAGAGADFPDGYGQCENDPIINTTGYRMSVYTKLNDVGEGCTVNDTTSNNGECYATESLTQVIQNSIDGEYENTGCNAGGGVGQDNAWNPTDYGQNYQYSFIQLACKKTVGVLGLEPFVDTKTAWGFDGAQWAVEIEACSDEDPVTPAPIVGQAPLLNPQPGPVDSGLDYGDQMYAASPFVP